MTAPLDPEPPAVLEDWIARWAPETDAPGTRDLLERAVAALQEALARPGRDRDAAEALLAADGLLTLACERAVEADDPERELLDILERVVRV